MSTINKEEIIKKFGTNEKDSGKTEVQIAILTEKISQLSSHLAENKKDFHSRYGLMKMVNQRKKMIKYLQNNDSERHQKILKDLNLRK